MNCREFWNAMPELEGEGNADALAHLQECTACAAVLENQRALTAGLRGLAAELEGVRAPGRVEGKLLAAFRGQAGLAAPPPARRWWRPVAVWAAAAALVAAAFLLFIPKGRIVQVPHKTPAAAELASVDWTAGLPVDASSEPGGDFIPLPNAERLPNNENLNLVRVEVPRSAMIALGYAVTADRAAERVRADVVLGSDGLARAVRFLDE